MEALFGGWRSRCASRALHARRAGVRGQAAAPPLWARTHRVAPRRFPAAEAHRHHRPPDGRERTPGRRVLQVRGAADGGDSARHQGVLSDPLRLRAEGHEALRALGPSDH
eukprot:3763464-Pyramimonas_sp.AAC.1